MCLIHSLLLCRGLEKLVLLSKNQAKKLLESANVCGIFGRFVVVAGCLHFVVYVLRVVVVLQGLFVEVHGFWVVFHGFEVVVELQGFQVVVDGLLVVRLVVMILRVVVVGRTVVGVCIGSLNWYVGGTGANKPGRCMGVVESMAGVVPANGIAGCVTKYNPI